MIMVVVMPIRLAYHSFVLCHLCFSRLRVIAELRHGDLFHSANIVSRLVLLQNMCLISCASTCYWQCGCCHS